MIINPSETHLILAICWGYNIITPFKTIGSGPTLHYLWKWFESNLDAYEKTSLLGLFLPNYPKWGEISEVPCGLSYPTPTPQQSPRFGDALRSDGLVGRKRDILFIQTEAR